MSRTARIHRWADLTAPELARIAGGDAVAVVVTAATEQHGPHLPLSTDVDIGEGILAAALDRLGPDSAFDVLVLPTLAVGASPEHADVAGTLDRSSGGLRDDLLALGASVARAGIRRLVLVNSHGGNRGTIDDAALALRRAHSMLVVKAHWFRFPRPAGVDFGEAEWQHGLHGGAVETSMMLHLHPGRVRADAIRPFDSLGERLTASLTHLGPEGTASFAWMARDLNREGAIGDASRATAQAGAALVAHFAEVLADVVRDAHAFELATLVTDPDEDEAIASLLAPLRASSQWVIGQLGQSLDGRIATESGHSHYVNGPADIRRLHALRALADAVVVGAGTVESDDPRLTVRAVEGTDPVRVVLDPRGRLSADHRVFSDGAAPTLHLVGGRSGTPAAEGAQVERITLEPDGTGRFDPAAVIALLRARGLARILVEGGGLTVSSFLAAGALDRLHISVAPILLGSGRPSVVLPTIDTLDGALRPTTRRVILATDTVFDLELGPTRD